MEKNWKKGIARDVMALGSIPFYFIVIIRAIIGKYAIFVYQLLIAAIILFLLMKIFRKSNAHIARGLILVVFTSLFYRDNLYTTFAFLLWIFIANGFDWLLRLMDRFIIFKKNMTMRGKTGCVVRDIVFFVLRMMRCCLIVIG